ncbi:UDP-N-acetylmuramoyl-tripeptide--D-alanyl-D-alanine ligase [Sporohalobacter salinus]|uniref:UDP-N-acetylmuramoyl-tripeptide--D-alanyl-D- alanine ligase n=1 Tax=Sporohalobacter salinus TaxID=1494606 RepID=UPI00195FB384|nr:UDP-N-acetylmuramoyl-tripeptide--D-alanyl-D-alanine ligase [Sporohalobacter salinus]MBM7624376.1 UDP-N-acetylmuramoyl-tripeptide--D-alanyl-D-alanine ligase [Sporohalobacter salinus]
MEVITVKEFISEINGKLINGNLEAKIQQVSIDSRTINSGELFFAIEGERFDGHNFVMDALESGAVGAVVNIEKARKYNIDSDRVIICVKDTTQALQDLAKYYRSLFDIPVVGITGSTGKTTTKDLIASVLETKFKTLKTEGNYNNEFGLPLTLFRLDSTYEAVVVELAMRGLGDIETLCQIAQLQIGVVTNVGLTHLECLGSQENIAKAKSELVESLPSGGTAILNGDDNYVRQMAAKTESKVLYYGRKSKNDLQVNRVKKLGEKGLKFKVKREIGNFKVNLPLPGEYNVYNALAAIGVGLEFGLNIDKIKQGLVEPSLTGMRGEIKELEDNITLINDAYNANPTSMEAGLDLLVDVGTNNGCLIAVLGDMLELGSAAEDVHRKVGETIVKNKVDYLLTVGDLAALIGQEAMKLGMDSSKVFICNNNQEINRQLLQLIKPDDTILLKGSRGMKLEEVEEALLEN